MYSLDFQETYLVTFLPFVVFNNRAGVVFGQVMHTKQLLLVSVMCET